MNTRIISIIVTVLCSFPLMAQSYDDRIGNAINSGDWFELDSIYCHTPKDSIHPFLEIFSRCLLGNRLNRPDISTQAFQELFKSQTEFLSLDNLISSATMFGMDMSRLGYNTEAASMINSILESTKQYLDSATIANLTNSSKRYGALSGYAPYQIEMPQSAKATIPFTIEPVGPVEKGSVLMHLVGSTINGLEADITFDTGAGGNLVSPAMAEKYNLIPLEETKITVCGVERRDGYMAMAREIKLGDLTVRDVPFVVVDFLSNNEEADQYYDAFNIVVGSDLMIHLKDLTIDFINRQITVPTVSPSRSGALANMCFSPTMNLLTKGIILTTPVMMCLDSGDGGFGAVDSDFYQSNKVYVRHNGREDSVRMAGIGGYTVEDCYYVGHMPVTFGGSTVIPSEFVVKTQKGATPSEYDARIGLRTLMLFGRIRFNMVDFVVSTELPRLTSVLSPTFNKTASLNLTREKGPNLFQTIGIVGMSIANGLLNQNAPSKPDL